MSDFPGLDKALQQLSSIENLDFVRAEVKGVEIIADEARRLVPVDTGELQDSIEVIVEGNTVSLVAGTDHALPVEFGTIKMAAQPYMRPALDTKESEALQAIVDDLNKQIKSKL
jgi:HK97 gp10 family phage protein